MNVLNRMMSYDKTKNENQEKCNCAECIGNAEISEKTEIIGNFEYADDFLIKVENYRMMCREYEILNMMNLEYWYKDVKTKWFIFRALWIHGNKYDYHKSVYLHSDKKVEIKCRIKGHDSFPQTPHSHLNGEGCKLCGIKNRTDKKRMTLKEFIEKANKIHGIGRYDYSKVNYIDSDTEVLIICHNHKTPNIFPQKPSEHLKGKGCRICGMKLANKKHTMTTEEFIKKARKIHGNKYDYSKVIYIKYKIEVIITCREHGDFKQTPSDHINGSGCSMCSESRGETKVRVFLENNNIEFEREKKFKDCRDKNPLPFDFYLPQYNLCIEFDGRQHFEPSAFNSKKEKEDVKLENFEYIQRHDRIKNEYCKKNGITLLRFNNLKTAEQELAEYFQNHGTITELSLFDL